MQRHALYPAGNITSWTWVPGAGWLGDTAPRGGLPPQTGFGFRGSIDEIARSIGENLADTALRWETLLRNIPLLKYCDYLQLLELKNTLKGAHGIRLQFAQSGLPWECGKLS